MAEPTSRRETSRYTLHDRFAGGGVATVHFGFLVGDEGFSRCVAIKRLRPHVAEDRDVSTMFFEEARLAARVRHPNVVQTLDVVMEDGEPLVVMEYVAGESLATLVKIARQRSVTIPVDIVSAIFVGVLDGLHAAHEARDERGGLLDIVHRDVSPQNVLVGADGIARVLDFGIAKARGRAVVTREGEVKGKLAYMAPEQLNGATTRASDIYSAAVCLWEALAMRRLFEGAHPSVISTKILAGLVTGPSEHASVPPELEAIVMRALHRTPPERYAKANEMARAIEAAVPPASPSSVAQWVLELARESIAARDARIAELERERALAGARPRTPVASPSRPRRRLLVVAAILGALAVSLTAVAMRKTAPAAPGPVTSSSSAVVVVTVTSPPPSPVDPVPAEVPTAAPSVRAPRKWSIRTAPSAAASKVDCNPPYNIDADGVRQYKKACFD